MRRFLVLGISLTLLLGACVRKGDLQPEEVLRRAAQSVQQLETANFTVRGTYANGEGTALSWNAKGSLSDAGSNVAFTSEVSGVLHDSADHTLKANLDVVVADGKTYFRVMNFSLTPPHPSVKADQIAALANTWYVLGDEPISDSIAVTPDPGILRAQSQVIRVTSDRGLERVSGHDSYSYEVEIDRTKLETFLRLSQTEPKSFKGDPLVELLSGLQGQMLIDASAFFVDRFRWSAGAAPGKVLSLDMMLTNHNAAEPVSPPANAIPFDVNALNTNSFALPMATQDGAFPLFP